jgi:CubicO group peptidase (beta-lactamase class C family)
MDSMIERLDSTFNSQFGMGIVVVKNDKIIYEKYKGFADVENLEKVAEGTEFYLSSITKSFTAMAALLLHEKGKLDLDKRLTQYFNDIKFEGVPYADSINIRHLLSHTSGISNDYLADRKAYYGNYTHGVLLKLLSKFTTTNAVGLGNFDYDNLGYNILELIIERELGQDWKEVVTDEVLKPIGMDETFTSLSALMNHQIPVAQPHYQSNISGTLEKLEIKKNDKMLHAAGGNYSTVKDMAKWLILQLNEGKINGKQAIPAHLIKLSHTPQAFQELTYIDIDRYGYGYGWNLGVNIEKDTIIHHFGGFPGYHSEVWLQPENDIGVAVMVNEGSGIGIVTSYLLSSYAIDYFLHPEGIDEKYENQLAAYSQMAMENFESMAKEKEKRSERQWKLELPNQMYVGTYTSEELGSIQIAFSDSKGFQVTHGLIKSKTVEPYTLENSMRVDILENGSVFKFNIKDGKVKSLVQEDVVYIKEY